MRYLSVIALTALFVMSAMAQTTAQSWDIVPGSRVGPVSAGTSETELIKIFGKENVKRTAIDVGEGETMPGTVLFPNDPQRRASIIWRDPLTRLQPESVTIRGKKSIWKTDKGITLGTTLQMIEQLNGKPFVLTGFAWDYSGTIIHANGGQLTELGRESGEEILDRTLILRLEPSASKQGSREYNAVLGDGKFSSDHPSMKKLNPSVYEMIVEFLR